MIRKLGKQKSNKLKLHRQVGEVTQRKGDQRKMNQRILERVGREAKTAKNLRFCRERDKAKDQTTRILYEHTENRGLGRLDKESREKASSGAAFKFEVQGRKSINTAKLDYSPNPNAWRLQNFWRYGTKNGEEGDK